MVEWTEDKLKQLKIEFDTGISASNIAKILSIKFNEKVTRNCVLGKLYRLKLNRTALPRTKIVKEKKKRRKSHKIEKDEKMILLEIEPSTIYQCSIYQLNNGKCHWPIGDGPPFIYCGAATNNHRYCDYHHNRSLRSTEWKKRLASNQQRE